MMTGKTSCLVLWSARMSACMAPLQQLLIFTSESSYSSLCLFASLPPYQQLIALLSTCRRIDLIHSAHMSYTFLRVISNPPICIYARAAATSALPALSPTINIDSTHTPACCLRSPCPLHTRPPLPVALCYKCLRVDLARPAISCSIAFLSSSTASSSRPCAAAASHRR